MHSRHKNQEKLTEIKPPVLRLENTLNGFKGILDITEENITVFEDSDRNYAK